MRRRRPPPSRPSKVGAGCPRPVARCSPRTSVAPRAAPRSCAGSAARTATRRCRRRATDKVVGTPLANRILALRRGDRRADARGGRSAWPSSTALFMPRGWFTPVTPGTKFVTLGGMVASDVHGKNHHREGCFGAHVRAAAHAPRRRLTSSTAQPDRARRSVLGDRRRHGPARPHPRGRRSSSSASRAPGSGWRASASASIDEFLAALKRGRAEVADDDGLDRLPRAGAARSGAAS